MVDIGECVEIIESQAPFIMIRVTNFQLATDENYFQQYTHEYMKLYKKYDESGGIVILYDLTKAVDCVSPSFINKVTSFLNSIRKETNKIVHASSVVVKHKALASLINTALVLYRPEKPARVVASVSDGLEFLALHLPTIKD